MKSKKDEFLQAAAETTHTAAERSQDVVEKAAEVIAEYVDSLQPYVEKAGDKVRPYAHQARKRGAAAAHSAVETLGPKVNDVLERIPPAAESAKDKFSDDLLPRLSEVLQKAAELPVAQEVGRRGEATVAALKGEVEVPKHGGAGRWVKRIGIVAAIGGVLVVLFKKFLDPKDSGWETYQPSAPYAGSTTTRASDLSGKVSAAASDASDAVRSAAAAAGTKASDLADTVKEKVTGAADAAGEAAEDAKQDLSEAADKATDAAASAADKYGPESFIGDTPPEGYAVKGNARSMKFHTPDNGGYDRTIADVWFASPEAAEAAGFVRAQR